MLLKTEVIYDREKGENKCGRGYEVSSMESIGCWTESLCGAATVMCQKKLRGSCVPLR